MATDAFWEMYRERVLGNYRFPLNATFVRAGMMSFNTVQDALTCFVVGMSDNAHAILDSLLPRLREELRTEAWIAKDGRFGGTQVLKVIAKSAHLAYWLKHDKFDPTL